MFHVNGASTFKNQSVNIFPIFMELPKMYHLFSILSAEVTKVIIFSSLFSIIIVKI